MSRKLPEEPGQGPVSRHLQAAMEYRFLDQTLQQLCECLRSWEGERKLESLVMDNSIWGISQCGKGRVTLSASLC